MVHCCSPQLLVTTFARTLSPLTRPRLVLPGMGGATPAASARLRHTFSVQGANTVEITFTDTEASRVPSPFRLPEDVQAGLALRATGLLRTTLCVSST